MISGLWNGRSGVTSQQEALSVQSNNITNVNTAGYKKDTISFQDLIYESSGQGNGAGTQLIEKNFEQGNLKITGNDYDFAVDGKGFFIIEDRRDADIMYSRAGDFRMGTNGNLVTAGNDYVHGLVSGTATAVATNPNKTIFTNEFNQFLASQDITTSSGIITINAKSTNYNDTAVDTGVSGSGYKTAGALIADVEALRTDYRNKLSQFAADPDAAATSSIPQITEIPFNSYLTDLNDSSDYVEVLVDGQVIKQNFTVDSQTTMNKFADQISMVQGLTASVDGTGLVTITSLVPGDEVTISDARLNSNAPVINTVQSPVLGTGQGMVDSARDALQVAIEAAGAEFLNLTNSIDTSTADSLATSRIQLKLDSLGFSSEGFGEIEAVNGTIYMKQGDNKFVVGQLSTAYFNNLSGLVPEGGNNFSATQQSGEAIYSGNLNTIASGTLEMSNSDLSVSLTDLMVYQRAFEASAKSISTSDEFLKTAIQLKA